MPKGIAVVLGFCRCWQSALLIDCVVQDIKRTHNVVPFTTNMARHLAILCNNKHMDVSYKVTSMLFIAKAALR
jgi:hypothetical protein